MSVIIFWDFDVPLTLRIIENIILQKKYFMKIVKLIKSINF